MPWYIEPVAKSGPAGSLLRAMDRVGPYGEDEVVAHRIARKMTKRSSPKREFEAVYHKEAAPAPAPPPTGKFLNNIQNPKRVDNGDGTVTVVDSDGTPRLVVGKGLADELAAQPPPPAEAAPPLDRRQILVVRTREDGQGASLVDGEGRVVLALDAHQLAMLRAQSDAERIEQIDALVQAAVDKRGRTGASPMRIRSLMMVAALLGNHAGLTTGRRW